jgi:hypothetical protein
MCVLFQGYQPTSLYPQAWLFVDQPLLSARELCSACCYEWESSLSPGAGREEPHIEGGVCVHVYLLLETLTNEEKNEKIPQ